jgi:hypothetical protein
MPNCSVFGSFALQGACCGKECQCEPGEKPCRPTAATPYDGRHPQSGDRGEQDEHEPHEDDLRERDGVDERKRQERERALVERCVGVWRGAVRDKVPHVEQLPGVAFDRLLEGRGTCRGDELQKG